MTELLEFRDKIKHFYSKNEVFILPLIKLIIAFIVFNTINDKLGYMTRIDNIAVVIIVALMCSFLPAGAMVFLAAVITLAHMYSLSLEVLLVVFCVYMLMFLLFLRFSPKDSLVVVLTPVLCMYGLPYIMPVILGLVGGPASAVSVSCGVIIYFLLHTIYISSGTINSLGAEEATAKIRLLIDGFLGNKQMMVMIVAFAATVFVVYLIRRMSVDYSWTIAIVAGIMVELVILLVGDLLYDTGMAVLNAILGAVITVVAAKIIEFFRFCVDYSRTEKVQFEDDEYYYYVKAVPKMSVAAQTKTVKRINTQKSQSRNVTTVRTSNSQRTPQRTRDYDDDLRERRAGSRTVIMRNDDDDDDFEDLF